MSLIYHSILVAIVSVVFTEILLDEDMIFGFWARWINRLPKKIAYPLGGCAYCFGGQVALWYYFFVEDWNVFNHVFFVSITIFFVHLILWIYDRTSGENGAT